MCVTILNHSPTPSSLELSFTQETQMAVRLFPATLYCLGQLHNARRCPISTISQHDRLPVKVQVVGISLCVTFWAICAGLLSILIDGDTPQPILAFQACPFETT